ncbi:MAG: PQQ-binding-like beta-propeller repeat protein [Planctomycetota bacterium]
MGTPFITGRLFVPVADGVLRRESDQREDGLRGAAFYPEKPNRLKYKPIVPSQRREPMMRRIAVSCLVLLVSLSNSYRLRAQVDESKLVPVGMANRHGLTRAWYTQLRIAPGSQSTVEFCLHVNSTQAQTIFRVIPDRGPIASFSDRDLDIFGEPLGEEGAEDAAADKAELLKRLGVDSRIEQSVVPDSTMYASTNSGMIHAIDAETGRPRWTKAVGTMRYPTSSPAATDTRLAIVNGQTLYILETENGQILEERRVVGGPGAGPAISSNHVYLPLLNGQLKAYTIGPNAPSWLNTYPALGRTERPPTIAGQYVVCANQQGAIVVIVEGERGVRARLRVKNELSGPIRYAPPRQILAMTTTGDLYSFDLGSKQMMWRYVSGHQTSQPPAVVGDNVFVMTRDSGVLAVSTENGEALWPTPYQDAHQFVAATDNHVYCMTERKELVALDLTTGRPVSRISLNLTDRAFANMQTDRIYIVTQNGALQCFHELGADLPTLHLAEDPDESAEETAEPEGEKVPPTDSRETESTPAPKSGDLSPNEEESPFE